MLLCLCLQGHGRVLGIMNQAALVIAIFQVRSFRLVLPQLLIQLSKCACMTCPPPILLTCRGAGLQQSCACMWVYEMLLLMDIVC